MTDPAASHDAPSPSVIVVGAGLAGLAVALRLAEQRPVLVLAKGRLDEAATAWAQGGIVGVLAPDDSIEAHVADTCEAGAGLVDVAAARRCAERSADVVRWLRDLGVPFTPDPDGPLGLHLTREGGHSVRRIAHAADATGAAIHRTLLAAARRHPRITLRERWQAAELRVEGGRCTGLVALDLDGARRWRLPAAAVVLATGGLGQVYRHTSNPSGATGDGVALAWRAGCRVSNLEFVQFHPTCLAHPQAAGFLVTEALRGEGALLRRPNDGERFMPAHDARAELAPRDIVARAIEAEMRTHGLPHVHLDATHLGAAFLAQRFPTVLARCAALGIDITREPIPVAPAAHYGCGGVLTDLDGRTDLPGLWAAGETACTGLHGANRLASNSLLECVVVGHAAADTIVAEAATAPLPAVKADPLAAGAVPAWIADARATLQATMAREAGIVRSTAGLRDALATLEVLRRRAEADAACALHAEGLALRQLATTASLIVRGALSRTESRGAHCSADHPQRLPTARPSVLALAA